ncbi:HEAT repeat domain-containing protein [Sorangium sp. So ce341]|uniref:HEAT repeat domain-containing protein n=1 Tax=Sorangium sp. So ce341 TaxID=3133302 RepID=UPI003F5D8B8A
MSLLRAAPLALSLWCAACDDTRTAAPPTTVPVHPSTARSAMPANSAPPKPTAPLPAPPSGEPPAAPDPNAEVDEAVRTMLDPHGGPGHNHAKAEAFEVLAAHPQLATERLLTLTNEKDPPVNILLALGRLGRDEAVDPLARALETATDPATVIAAQALGEHPSPRALAALEKALRSSRAQVVASASIALAARGDKAACPALAAVASHPDPHAREWVEKARRKLGCG